MSRTERIRDPSGQNKQGQSAALLCITVTRLPGAICPADRFPISSKTMIIASEADFSGCPKCPRRRTIRARQVGGVTHKGVSV